MLYMVYYVALCHMLFNVEDTTVQYYTWQCLQEVGKYCNDFKNYVKALGILAYVLFSIVEFT